MDLIALNLRDYHLTLQASNEYEGAIFARYRLIA